MRLKDAVVSLPMHPGLNNNQLQQSEVSASSNTEEIENCNDRTSSFTLQELKDFRVARETTSWQATGNVVLREDDANNVASLNHSNGRNNINNNLTASRLYQSSSAESLADYEGRNSVEDSSHELTPSEWSDWSEEGNLPSRCKGIVNPNYPGFQHLATSLLSDADLTEDEIEAYETSKIEGNLNNNKYNNNTDENLIGGSVNHLQGQPADRKFMYEKPKFNIHTVNSLYESALPPTEKCINYVKSVEVSRSGEVVSPEPETNVNSVIEAETHLTVLEPSEAVADATQARSELCEAIVAERQTRELAIEVEVVELTTAVKETLQFPEIEEIPPDSGKTGDVGEEETVVEQQQQQQQQIDLIREAKQLPLDPAAKIGGKQSAASSVGVGVGVGVGVAGQNDDSETNTDSESYSDLAPYSKLEEIDLLSSIGRDIGVDLEKYVQPVPDVILMESIDASIPNRSEITTDPEILKEAMTREDTNKLIERENENVGDARKKEKMARNQARRRQQTHANHNQSQRRPDKRRADPDLGPGGFDVYNIETAMPKIDLDAIESHLRAAREEERREDERVAEVVQAVAAGRNPEPRDHDKEDLVARFDRLVQGNPFVSPQRRNDREEIRRRLAMGPDADDLRTERGRKPSLQSRLQSGMNLQICFMNDTSSDTESPVSDGAMSPGSVSSEIRQPIAVRPQVLSLPPLRVDTSAPIDEADFFARQARLQTEARMALAQAKEMAHMQMEVERQRLKQSPITEMVRSSLEKVGVQLGDERRRLSRVLLTELNVAQLQVVANDLHARIAALNEALVEGLLRRDDLHMEQDSMLVDVEDLTRHLGAKQESSKRHGNLASRDSTGTQFVKRPQGSSLRSKLSESNSRSINRGFVSLVRK